MLDYPVIECAEELERVQKRIVLLPKLNTHIYKQNDSPAESKNAREIQT